MFADGRSGVCPSVGEMCASLCYSSYDDDGVKDLNPHFPPTRRTCQIPGYNFFIRSAEL